jgi:predicted DCC family thiol-disulfide oxidoreductase YuxK
MKKPLNPSQYELTIFIDGGCPLCAMEMRHLQKKDRRNAIEIIDLNNQTACSEYPQLDSQKAMSVLHGRLSNGEWITGLDVTHKAWSIVGYGRFTAFLRWRWLRPITDRAYLFFAKNRHTLSKWFTGQSRIETCTQCEQIPPKGHKK